MTFVSDNLHLEDLLNSFKLRMATEDRMFHCMFLSDVTTGDDTIETDYLIGVDEDTIVDTLNTVVTELGVKKSELMEEPAFARSATLGVPKGFLTGVTCKSEDGTIFNMSVISYAKKPSSAITLSQFKREISK